MPKLIRLTTSPIAFKYLLKGQMKFMRSHGLEVIMISSDGPDVKDVIAAEECAFMPVNMTRAITPVHDMKAINHLVRIFRKERPDIVHTHTPKAGLVGMIAARLAGVPIRLHSNSGTPLISATGLKRKMYALTESLTNSAATTVLPNSQSLLNYLVGAGVCKPSKIHLIGQGSTNGINVQAYRKEIVDATDIEKLKQAISWNGERFYFLFAGRLLSSKGIIELVSAFKRINHKFPQASLILAGNIESHLDAIPADTIREIGSHPAIHQLGWVTDIRVPMAISDVLVHPSHREGFPNVLLQAGCMHLPVICSDCIGNVDIITPGKDGIMFPVKDEKALEASMEMAITSPDLIRSYEAALYQHVTENFDMATVQANLLSFYHSQLSAQKPRP